MRISDWSSDVCSSDLRLSDAAQTRFYLTLNHLDQEVPGTLALADVKANPRSAPRNNRLNDHARNIRSARALNRTVISLGGATALEFGGFLNVKSLYHPIFQVIDYETVDWGGFTRLTGGAGSFAWTLGAQAQFGTVDARQYVNIDRKSGMEGMRVSDRVDFGGRR